MSHYPEQIKFYGSATGFTISIGEVMQNIQIKDFFKQTNIKKSYKKQILDHNVEKFSLIVRDDIDLFLSTKVLTQANKNAILQVNSVSDIKKIKKDLKWHIERNEQVK